MSVSHAAEAAQQKQGSQGNHGGPGGPPFIPVSIDNKPYKAPHSPITGAELRALPDPDVPVDRDLWLEVPGSDDDIKVLPTATIEVKSGAQFYTAPGTINPGQGS